ncbi:hypothetical protein L7F22_011621 [Adiantum nelumboides]|nr:hypothetical protein [Adiantum nelumboides]
MMISHAITRLQHGRAIDQYSLHAEHIIYGRETLAPLIAHLFNRALAEGFPDSWIENTIVPIHKPGDPMDPSTYRTIMIGPILAKLYGTVMEEALSTLAEGEGLRAAEQAGFRRAFSTTYHIFTLRCLIDQARVKKIRLHCCFVDFRNQARVKKIRLHCCFVDFRKAFDTVPRERLFRRLAALGVGDEMMWAIFALYERVTGRVRCPGGLSDPLVSTIGVKQECPLSPTLFGLYIDEIVSFIQSSGGEGVELGGTTVHILLYADDIVLVSESAEGLQQHLRGLDDFCSQRGMTVNLGKTKVLIFHTSARVRRQSSFTAAGGDIEIIGSYVYLGMTFTATSGAFSMAQAARDRLTRGYSALAQMERECHQAHFQEPRTKGWPFDTLVETGLLTS